MKNQLIYYAYKLRNKIQMQLHADDVACAIREGAVASGLSAGFGVSPASVTCVIGAGIYAEVPVVFSYLCCNFLQGFHCTHKSIFSRLHFSVLNLRFSFLRRLSLLLDKSSGLWNV